MPQAVQYRCHFFDSTGKISESESIECFSDEQAVVAALRMWEQRTDHSGMELWDGERRISRHAVTISFER